MERRIDLQVGRRKGSVECNTMNNREARGGIWDGRHVRKKM